MSTSRTVLRSRNAAGAPAFAFEARHALAQLAATGCLQSTYYTRSETQATELLQAAAGSEPDFVARCAVYARQRGQMKDAPALLAAWLAVHAPARLPAVFDRVIDNGRQLRGFVGFLRSGVLGRRAIPRPARRLIRGWLERASPERLFRDSVGQQPSLADVIRMVHPRPADPGRSALYGRLIGREVDEAALPSLVRELDRYRETGAGPVPDVPFRMLTDLALGRDEWMQIARRASWQMTRMNLNTFTRHGVWEDPELVALVAERLRDPETIRRARVFPYQLLAAHMSVGADVPEAIREALHDAMEVAIENVPAVPGRVVVCPDVSGSMASPVTGYRRGATSTITCHHVSALVAAAFLRRSDARVIAFENRVVPVSLDAGASVMANATRIARVGGGGTDCSAPLRLLNTQKAAVDLVVFVSDNQSWIGSHGTRGMLPQWNTLRERNPGARLVCIDVQPYANTQAPDREDILNVGGFSDAVFEMIAAFAAGELSPEHWVGEIEKIALD